MTASKAVVFRVIPNEADISIAEFALFGAPDVVDLKSALQRRIFMQKATGILFAGTLAVLAISQVNGAGLLSGLQGAMKGANALNATVTIRTVGSGDSSETVVAL